MYLHALHRCAVLFSLFAVLSFGCTPTTPPVAAPGSAAGTALPSPPAGGVVAGYQTATPDSPETPDKPDKSTLFMPRDVFELEWAADPRISPDSRTIVYVRNYMDIMKDSRRSSLWTIAASGDPATHRPIPTGMGNHNVSMPRFSPDGTRLAYITAVDGRAQLFVRWLDTGQATKITNLVEGPGSLVWSPDGRSIAFTMLVREPPKPFAQMPPAPKGAEWAPPPKVIDKVLYRIDGAGYLPNGYQHVFTVPADGGTPRQLTRGGFHHAGTPAWSPDGQFLIVSANRQPDWEYQPNRAELYEFSITNGAMRALTDRVGPDFHPRVSPDGSKLLYLGYDDKNMMYHLTRLYIADRDGKNPRALLAKLDRDVESPEWSADGRGIYFQYSDKGDTKLAYVSVAGNSAGKVNILADKVGGLSIGRPYGAGAFTVSKDGVFAYTLTSGAHPADIAVGDRRGTPRRVTALNDDIFGHRVLGEVEEVWFPSSHDNRQIQGWIVKPPGFDPKNKYPLILEIHGGPLADYGPRFSTECQLYAAAGYVVLYTNPRGSTSYGEAFANLIHHAYPGNDYDDLMSGVDAVLARGYVDPKRLYVTGGSGGGVLTSWIVGKTNRFRAAVVAKPVINWYSFVLSADFYAVFWKYWFPGYPWEHPEHYHKRSPLSLVGNVQTPTMLLTGENDYRTPIAESEQYYHALKLRKIDTALVRIPGASHGIARRPSQLIAKVVYILAWFERYDKDPKPAS